MPALYLVLLKKFEGVLKNLSGIVIHAEYQIEREAYIKISQNLYHVLYSCRLP